MFNITDKSTTQLLLSRRSEKSRRMVTPGPTADELKTILQCGMRVSDHGKIAPWKFVVFEGKAQKKLSTVLADGALKAGEDENSPKHKAMQDFATQAPVVITVLSKPDSEHKVPNWEQELSVGAACQNLIVAAHSLGFVAQWLTGDSAYNPHVREFFSCGQDDKIAGFIFIGSSEGELKERPRPDFDDIVTYFKS